jgi:hypothetical protein
VFLICNVVCVARVWNRYSYAVQLSAATFHERRAGGTRAASHRDVSGPARVRRIALVAACVALAPAVLSYLHTMSEPSNSKLGIRTVEWVRDHGAAGLVAQIESIYYRLTAPAKGGAALRALPRVGYGATKATNSPGATEAVVYRPPRVDPLIAPALPGEGVWHATRPGLEAEPPLLVTTLRNQPEYPRVVAGLAWIDTQRTTLTLNPGRLEPSVPLPRGPAEVPHAKRGKLLATFNSGFKLTDSKGGFALNGHTYAPMRDGQATLVGDANGSVNVIDWRYGATAPSSVSFARQNLPLIVDEGRLNPNLSNGAQWGATVENAVLVWRSGIGVDSHGNLIYAAGNDETVESLARTLQHAGAVRAMELDINSYWVSFITYEAPGAADAANLLPDMERPSTRYLEPDDRDFFAVYAR